MTDWNDSQPIFRQLADRIIEQILQGIWSEGQALPSVRSVAADLKINHLTVMKGYQLLVDEDLIEKRRGQGMFVTAGGMHDFDTIHTIFFPECTIFTRHSRFSLRNARF